MPQEPNKALRVIVPILIIAGGLLVAWSVMQNTGKTTAPPPGAPASGTPATVPGPAAPASPPAAPDGKPAQSPPAAAPASPQPAPEQPSVGPATTTPAQPATAPGHTAVFYPAGTEKPFDAIGGLDKNQPYVMELKFSPIGAGLESLTLRDHFETIEKKTHETLQKFHPNRVTPRLGFSPMAVSGVEIIGAGGAAQFVNLGFDAAREGSFWRQTGPGEFEATILGPDGAPAAKVVRRYRLEQGSYDFALEQRVENLGQQPLVFKWYQFAPVDLPMGTVRYGGDKRRARFGYLLSPQIDPSRQFVEARRFLVERTRALAGTGPAGSRSYPSKVLWPNDDSTKGGLSLVWVGLTNRYFAVVTHPLVTPPTPGGPPVDKTFATIETVDRFVLPGPTDAESVMILRLVSPRLTAAPAGRTALDMGVYAGPMSREYLSPSREPRAEAVGIDQIIIANFGGPCAFCTFQTIVSLLHDFLSILQKYVVHDWALAIIVLVVCVRTILHPVTKRSQISMLRFGRQMAALAPKQKAIQEKYKSDPVKMREELGRLMREENVNYGAMLGCLPAFLQTPIWIALSAMLFFSSELRQTPAFFGVFQKLSLAITGKPWTFMADLSEPDHFIGFGHEISIPLISSIMGKIDGLNLLPIVMGIVFFIQQKYLTPPPSTPLTPEQEQQQKIMKIMMVVMFPVLMYNAPCGLALYFLCNSTLGILESRYIRRHADKVDLAKKNEPGAPRKPGLLQRLQEQMEMRRQMMERARGIQKDRDRK